MNYIPTDHLLYKNMDESVVLFLEDLNASDKDNNKKDNKEELLVSVFRTAIPGGSSGKWWGFPYRLSFFYNTPVVKFYYSVVGVAL